MHSRREELRRYAGDGPGSNIDTSRTLLLIADLAVIPCKASMLEVWALNQATAALRHARQVRRNKPPAIIVLSMVGKTYRLTKDMRNAAAALRLPFTKTALTLRQVYADAPGQGRVVWHLGARAREAARQIQQLCRELVPHPPHQPPELARRGKLQNMICDLPCEDGSISNLAGNSEKLDECWQFHQPTVRVDRR